MDLLYKDEQGKFHEVRIHNFDRFDKTEVRVMGNISLNPSDKNYPDKKWVKIKDLFSIQPVNFSEEFISANTL